MVTFNVKIIKSVRIRVKYFGMEDGAIVPYIFTAEVQKFIQILRISHF